ncbi:hypothetical protein Tco_1227575 [Tanacetum coccineum]
MALHDKPCILTKLSVNFVIANDTQFLEETSYQEDIHNSESYKEYYAIASGKIPPKTKASKKKTDSDATTKQKPHTVPKKRRQEEQENGSRRLKNEGIGVSPGVPDAPDYDSDDDISWKSSEDDQDEDKNEDDENVQDDDDDAKSGDDEHKSSEEMR